MHEAIALKPLRSAVIAINNRPAIKAIAIFCDVLSSNTAYPIFSISAKNATNQIPCLSFLKHVRLTTALMLKEEFKNA